MKAVIIRRFGGPDVLEVSEEPRVSIKNEQELLISVRAIGVNPVDTYIRAGEFPFLPDLPFTLGYDAAGIVESVGLKVTKFKKGDRVYSTSTMLGTYAEYIVAEENSVSHLLENLTFEQGAAIGIPYFTSHRALFEKANAKKGDLVLIHGASGGCGTAAVQIAKAQGLTVIGTAGSEEGIEIVRNTGADFAVNHNEKRYTDEIYEFIRQKRHGVDIILEMMANKNLVKDVELLDRNGRIVVVGSRGIAGIDPGMLMGKEATIVGVAVFNASKEEVARTQVALQEGMKEGWLRPEIGKIYPLEKAKEAHSEMVKSKVTKGKTILLP